MKKLFTLLTAVLLLSPAIAGEFEKELGHFTSISVTGNFKVILSPGEKESAKIINKDEELEDERVELEIKGTELKIGIKNDVVKKWDMEIHITYTKLLNIDASKGGWVEVTAGLQGEEIELSATTDAVIVAQLACETVKASVLVSGTIRLTGTADIAEYKVTTGGFITGLNVKAKTVSAKITTGGEISCYASEKMDLKVSMGGTIKYLFDGEASNFTEKVAVGGNIEKYKE